MRKDEESKAIMCATVYFYTITQHRPALETLNWPSLFLWPWDDATLRLLHKSSYAMNQNSTLNSTLQFSLQSTIIHIICMYIYIYMRKTYNSENRQTHCHLSLAHNKKKILKRYKFASKFRLFFFQFLPFSGRIDECRVSEFLFSFQSALTWEWNKTCNPGPDRKLT